MVDILPFFKNGKGQDTMDNRKEGEISEVLTKRFKLPGGGVMRIWKKSMKKYW
jgi:hypothetical protein